MKSKSVLLLKLQQKTTSEGLTLVEALAALVIATIILAAAAPPLLLSAATRVQARKTEQAQAIAREEIEQVRGILSREEGIAPGNETGNIPPKASTSVLNNVDGPSTLVSDRANLDDPEKALTLDIDGDGENDFFVQLIRDQGVRFSAGSAEGQLAIFQMGVRVYDIAADENLDSLNTQPASLQMTNGLAERSTNPLAVTYTEISRSDLKPSLDEYREYICDTQPASCS